MSESLPFTLVGGHLTAVAVTLDDRRAATFVFDTGIGLTVISERLGQELGHPPGASSHTGRRMSGQSIVVPLTRLEALSVGSRRLDRPTVGVFDLAAFPGLDGFLALTFFEGIPLTVDYLRGQLIFEDAASLQDRVRRGTAVPAELRRDGPSLEVFVDLLLPSGSVAHVEVDSGSDQLILHERYRDELGIPTDPSGGERREGVDETGHRYVRYTGTLSGPVRLAGDPTLAQPDPPAIFQRIVHDGLIGRELLGRFAVTYDLAGARLIFGPPG